MVDLFEHAEVRDQDYLFDAHSPLLLHFRCPQGVPLRTRWLQPQSWLDFDVQADTFAAAYAQVAHTVSHAIAGVDSLAAAEGTFTFWASQVEHAVHNAIQRQRKVDPVTFPHHRLPKRCRGRCKPVRMVSRPHAQLPRPPRHGDFTPAYEATSVLVRMRTRQCRRIRSLLGGLRKAEALEAPDDAFIQHLLNQWHAILRAPGYGCDFSSWLLSWNFVVWVPVDWPNSIWLHEVLHHGVS